MSEDTSFESRLRILEEHVARQEHLLLQLNDVVAEIRGQFDRLEATFTEQQKQLRWAMESSLGSGSMEIEKPPHY